MKWIKQLIPYIIILIVVVLVRTFLVTPIKVNGSSMYNTLEGNELMLLWKVGDIKRYDIVVVNTETDTLIKRLYALPGETIECKNGHIYINNEKIQDDYAFGDTDDFPKVTLKENEYFVLGDNRTVSLDSRRIGPVSKESIEGKTNFILFPITKFGTVKSK